MTLSDKQFLFLKNVGQLIDYAIQHGYKLTFGEAYRPQLMQEHYYNTGKSKTLNSQHGKRLAIDFNVFLNGKYTTRYEHVKQLGDFWESLNPLNRWGGDWNGNDVQDEDFIDTPHFEMK